MLRYIILKNFGWKDVIQKCIGHVVLLIVLTIVGLIHHTIWSMTLSVIAIARLFLYLRTLGSVVNAIDKSLKEYGIYVLNINDYLWNECSLAIKIEDENNDQEPVGS